ncbi:GHMP kinase [Allomuricauda sp. d1]|uniref:mevalonate kinase family protein n=1 Tax=Allomuricauda sp. d1 TaxID=3136725 RepID=UPI0031CED61D
MPPISIKVPARICFYGDHQDYLGLPVIAGSIDQYINLRAEPISASEFRLDLKDIDAHRTIPLTIDAHDISQSDYLLAALAVLIQKGFRFARGYRLNISGDIPVNAGLSSSSALTIAWIRFLVEAQSSEITATDIEIGQWAYETEVTFFKSPGGLMDQYTIAQQGLLYIDTQMGKTEPLTGHLGKLVVAESGIAKETLDVLKNARLFQENAAAEVKAAHPDFEMQKSTLADYRRYLDLVSQEYRDHWYAAIHNYENTKQARRLLSSPESNLKELGQLMNEHQVILEECIQNTPPEMAKMMNAARNAGALGAKTIGSGGGGCMVAMVNDDSKSTVIDAFLENGAKAAYEVELVYP